MGHFRFAVHICRIVSSTVFGRATVAAENVAQRVSTACIDLHARQRRGSASVIADLSICANRNIGMGRVTVFAEHLSSQLAYPNLELVPQPECHQGTPTSNRDNSLSRTRVSGL
jgi:hypothetical protein